MLKQNDSYDIPHIYFQVFLCKMDVFSRPILSHKDQTVKDGFVQQADTIEELAEKLGLPKETLTATVERYNELYDKGVDEDFGKEAHRMSALRTAPFYGAKNCGYILCTMDGIQIDLNMNAVDTEGNAIPGLYVVGNDSGAYFSATYPNLSTGAACGRTVTFGRRAGRIAAEQENA